MSSRELCADASRLANNAITAHIGGHQQLTAQISDDLFGLLSLACSGDPDWFKLKLAKQRNLDYLQEDLLVDQPRSNLPFLVAHELIVKAQIPAEPQPAWHMWANQFAAGKAFEA